MRKAHTRLTLDTIISDIRHDPLLFSAQLLRRFSFPALRTLLSHVAEQLPHSRLRDRLASIIDRPDLASEKTPHTKTAREHYNHGDITQAIAQLPAHSHVKKIWQSEQRILQTTPRLNISPLIAPRTKAPKAHVNRISVLHALNSSLPFTQSGYTIRTQHLLHAQKEIGIEPLGITRPGYPVIIGYPFTSQSSHFEDITYHHLLPSTRPTTLEDRIAQHAFLLEQLTKNYAMQNAQLIHATTDYTNALATEAYGHAHNIPWIYEMRGMRELSWLASFPLHKQDTIRSSEKYRLWHATETRIARRADAVIVLSETQKHDLIERGVDSQSIWVVPHAYDISPNQHILSRKEAREKLGLPQADLWFGSVTSFVDYEGLDTLIHALAILRAKKIDARLALVGDGVTRSKLIALSEMLGLAEYIVFPGKVPLDESHTWYQALDYFALPRQDTPVARLVTPIKPFEALAYGIPLLVSHLPALAEITAHGVGLSIDSRSPNEWAVTIENNMPSSTAYTRMSKNALDFSAEHSWKENAKITEQIYRQVL